MLAAKFSGNFLINLLGVWAVSRVFEIHFKSSAFYIVIAHAGPM